MQELLRQYENLKNGRKNSFIEEDAFEKIINYFEEKEEFVKAMEAADIAIEQYPYSSALLVKKGRYFINCSPLQGGIGNT